MAQIGVQAPSNLMEMFSSASPMLWDIAQGQVRDQREGNALNRQQALQDMLFEQQNQPLNLESKQLGNQMSRENIMSAPIQRGLMQSQVAENQAQLPGIQANSDILQATSQYARPNAEADYKEKLRKAALTASADQLTQMETQVKTMRLSPDPKVRAQGDAMWGRLQEVALERDKIQARGVEDRKGTALAGAQNRSLEQLRIDAGKYDRQKQESTDLQGLVEGALSRAKSAKDQYAILTRATVAAEQQGNTKLAAEYAAQRTALTEQVVFENNAANYKPGDARLEGGKIVSAPDRTLAAPGSTSNNSASRPRFANEAEARAALAAGKIPKDVVEIMIGDEPVTIKK